jgi:hypothetical protein
MDRRSAVFTKHATFPELTANAQHKVLNCPIGSLNSVRQRWPIIPVNLVERPIFGTLHPQVNGCNSTTVPSRYFTDRGPLANSNDHSSSLISQRPFLPTSNLPGVSFCSTVKHGSLDANCSGGSDNRCSGRHGNYRLICSFWRNYFLCKAQ